MAKNIFVLDTCVLLHDPQSIYKFQEHDIYIPLAVIDDLDEIKTKKDQVAWAAREVFRNLEKFDIPQMMKGIKINEKGGKIFIYNNQAPLQKNEKPNISRYNSDNEIINSSLALQSEFPKRKVVIVTKDVGLKVRANSWGCYAENYKSDLIIDNEFKGYRHIQVDDQQQWDALWKSKEFDSSLLNEDIKKQLLPVYPNEFIVFKLGEQSCITQFKHQIFYVIKDKKPEFVGVTPKNLEQRMAMEVLADPNIPLVTLCGKAGSGKTLITLAVGLQGVRDGIYDRMIVIKPMLAVGGKEIGFLPGDKFEKISAWLGPIKDNLIQIVDGPGSKASENFEDMVSDGIIEVEAMAFIQGRSIPHSYIIIDEAANLSPREARMIVERCGKNSKIVLLGDTTQIENPYLDAKSCGLTHAVNGGKTHELAATITLEKVERSMLAAVASDIFIKNNSNM